MTRSTRIPYPGLRAFDSKESDLFFGRDGCVDDMVRLLAQTRFLAVLGTSGSGKSSLVRTGLLDSLELGFLPGAGSRWMIADMTPGGRPMHNLAGALVASGDPGGAPSLPLMEAFLSRGPRSLVQWCADGNLPEGTSLLLLVDQFEELFRYQDYAGQEQAEAFVALLMESVRSDQPIHVVITMRSEFLGACALMPGLAESINESLYLTRRMTRDECEEAIEGPAGVLGFKVEPKLVNRILNDLATFAPWEAEATGGSLAQLARRADQLPLMQHVLNRLWLTARVREGDCVLLDEDYETLGGLRGAIDAHAEDVVATIPAAHHDKIQTVFRALISGNTITDAVRNPRRFEELVALSGDREGMLAIVEAFRADGCNFLRPSADRPIEDDTVIDLGHESLIRQWSRMEGWLANESRSRAVWRRLVAATEAHAADEGDLLSGLDLDNARDWWDWEQPNEAWARKRGGDFDATRAFLDASIAAEDARLAAEAAESRRAQRALRLRAATFMILAVIGVGAAIFAFDARNDALEAQSQTLDAADRFLITSAKDLRRSIGVPRARVEEMFAKAEGFLDEVEETTGDPGLLYAQRTELALERANYASARSETDATALYVKAARQVIEAHVVPTDYSANDIENLLRINTLEAQAHYNADRKGEARFSLNERAQVLNDHRGTLSDDDAHYWNAAIESAESAIRGDEEAWSASLKRASNCLEFLGNIEEQDARVHGLALTCKRQRLKAQRKRNQATPDVVTAAEKALVLIPYGDKTRGDWDDWHSMMTELADTAIAAKDFARADSLMLEVAERFEQLSQIEPGEDRWMANVAVSQQTRGYSFIQNRDYDEAFDALLKAAEAYKAVESSFINFPVRASNYKVVLRNLSLVGNDLEKRHTDPEFIDQIIAIKQARLSNLEFIAEHELEDPCDSCAYEISNSLILWHREAVLLGDEDAYQQLLAAYDQQIEPVWDHLDEDRTDREARLARYFYSLATQNTAATVQDAADTFPDLAFLEFGEAAAPRIERYLKTFPRDHYVREIWGNVLAEMAIAQDRNGFTVEAIDSMKRAVAMGSFTAAQRMAEWYETGEGPIGRDPALAQAMQDRLATMFPGPFRFLMRSDNLFTEEQNYSSQYFELNIPPDPNLSIVEETVWRASTLEGHDIHPEEIEMMREVEQYVKKEDKNFIAGIHEKNGYDFMAHMSSRDVMVKRFYDVMEEFDSYEDMDELPYKHLYSALSVRLRENVPGALRQILEYRDYPRYDDAMKTLTDLPMAALGYLMPQFANESEHFKRTMRKSERFLMETLVQEFPNMDAKHVAAILAKRGQAKFLFAEGEQRAAGMADAFAAVTLAPNDDVVLNRAGYVALEDPYLRALGVEWLERALEVAEPGSDEFEFSLAALGRGYVLTGREEEGLALLQQFLDTTDEPSAEAYQTLTEAYRRLGRMDEAFDAAAKMTGHGSSLKIIEDRMRTTLALLEEHRDHGPGTLAAAKAILAELEEKPVDRMNVSVDRAGIAIRGYDPVAMVEDSVGQVGDLRFFDVRHGGVWLFASEKNRDAFRAEPEKYLPLAGGFNASMVAGNMRMRMHGQPEKWRYADGSVFLFGAKDDLTVFDRKGAEHVEMLKRRWSLVENEIEIAPSPPSIYEHMLIQLMDRKSEQSD